MGHGGQHSFEEQVVDIDANIVVIEGEVRGHFERETRRTASIPRTGAGIPGEAVEKDRPAFLKEREEGAPTRHDGLKGPGVELPATPEQVNQSESHWWSGSSCPPALSSMQTLEWWRISPILARNAGLTVLYFGAIHFPDYPRSSGWERGLRGTAGFSGTLSSWERGHLARMDRPRARCPRSHEDGGPNLSFWRNQVHFFFCMLRGQGTDYKSAHDGRASPV